MGLTGSAAMLLLPSEDHEVVVLDVPAAIGPGVDFRVVLLLLLLERSSPLEAVLAEAAEVAEIRAEAMEEVAVATLSRCLRLAGCGRPMTFSYAM